jgi:hypothetical protein
VKVVSINERQKGMDMFEYSVQSWQLGVKSFNNSFIKSKLFRKVAGHTGL